jgi:MFS family permease
MKRDQKPDFKKDLQYYKFCLYGFLKNLRLFEPFIVLFFLENELTFLQIGVLYAIREITRNLFEIPAGIIADALGRRRTMMTSFSFYIFSFIVFYLARDYPFFILAMVIYSLGDAFRTGTHKAMIFDYLGMKGWENMKVHYYGHTRSWSQMGSAFSALISAFFVFTTGSFRNIFLFSAIPYLLDLILITTYPKFLDGETGSFQFRDIIKRFRKVGLDFWESFKNFHILKILASASIYTGYYKATRDYLQPVLQTFALSLPVLYFLESKQRQSVIVGITFFLLYFLTSMAARRAGKFAGKFERINVPLNLTLIVGLFVGTMAGIFYQFEFLIWSIVFYILIYVIENLRKPIAVSYIGESGNKRILATTLSAESQAESLFAALLAPLVGLLADRFGLGVSIFSVSAFLLLLSPIYWLRRKN